MPTLGGLRIIKNDFTKCALCALYIRYVATAAHIKSFYGGDRSRTIFVTIALFEHKSVVKTDTNNLRNAQVNMENVYILIF